MDGDKIGQFVEITDASLCIAGDLADEGGHLLHDLTHGQKALGFDDGLQAVPISGFRAVGKGANLSAHVHNFFHAPQHDRQHWCSRRQDDELVGPIMEVRDGGVQRIGGRHQDLSLLVQPADAIHHRRGVMRPGADNHPGRLHGFKLPEPLITAARRNHTIAQGHQCRCQRPAMGSIVNNKNGFFHHGTAVRSCRKAKSLFLNRRFPKHNHY